MSRKKPSFSSFNEPIIIKHCDENGYPYEKFDNGHFRIFGAVAIVDIWSSRMTYRIMNIDGIQQKTIYYHNMKQQCDENQLKQLLERGFVR